MKLHGFINPVGKFPATVVPVWLDEAGTIYGVFALAQTEGPTGITRELCPLNPTSKVYVLPENWADHTIKECEPREVCLLALSSQKLLAYPAAKEEEILTALLTDPDFAADQPFARLAMAKLGNRGHLIAAELVACACRLLSEEVVVAQGCGKERVELWLREQRQFGQDQPSISEEVRALLLDLPLRLEELGSTTWWRQHLAVHPLERKWALEEMEDLSPSPKTAAILNIEPTVPNHVILGLMARHLLAGTNYVFFHAPTADTEALGRLRVATEAAVAEAARSAAGPLAALKPPLVGSIDFFALDKQWTGSPYVFYEIAYTGGTHVIGYRGLDVGTPIAKFYERLPDGVARELLEALTSQPPQKITVNGEATSAIFSIDEARKRKRG